MTPKKRNRTIVAMAIALAVCVFVIGDLAVQRAQALPDDTYKELADLRQRPRDRAEELRRAGHHQAADQRRHHRDAGLARSAQRLPHARPLSRSRSRNPRQLRRARHRDHRQERHPHRGLADRGHPAYKAGIKAGDQIVKIDSDFTKGMTLTDAVKRMRGPQGQQDPSDAASQGHARTVHGELTREVIKIKSVKAKDLTHGYDYIRVTSFQERHRRRYANGAGQVP